MSSLLGKTYSGLLHEVRLWVAIAEIGTDAMMHDFQMAGLSTLKPKAGSCKVLQSTVVADREVTRVVGCGRLYILQVINALRDKRFGHTRLFSICAQLLQTDREYIVPVYKKASLVCYWRPDAHVHA